MWVSYVSDTYCVLTWNIVEGEIVLTRQTRTLLPIVPSVTHCILGKPDQFRVTCPSIRKSNISQSAYYAKNTQYLSTKGKHLTSVHPSTLFFTLTVIYCQNGIVIGVCLRPARRFARCSSWGSMCIMRINVDFRYGWILGPHSAGQELKSVRRWSMVQNESQLFGI